MRLNLKPEACACGRTPKVFVSRVSEDCMETWVECACGMRGDEVEDAYSDSDTAVWCWNAGRRRRQALEDGHV